MPYKMATLTDRIRGVAMRKLGTINSVSIARPKREKPFSRPNHCPIPNATEVIPRLIFTGFKTIT
jgi:hypothetical protein